MDQVNAAFELAGGFFVALSVRRLYRDKQVKGVSLWPVVFFSGWGLWNVLFYPALGAYWSALGAVSTTLVNSIWLGQLVYYSYRPGGKAD